MSSLEIDYPFAITQAVLAMRMGTFANIILQKTFTPEAITLAENALNQLRHNFSGPYSQDEFISLRCRLISQLIQNTIPELPLHLGGFLTPNETFEIKRTTSADLSPSEADTAAVYFQKHFSHSSPSDLSPEQKIHTLTTGSDQVISWIRSDYRTVAVWGGFDYGTPTHSRFLSWVDEIAGPDGKVVALVASDEELKLTRGPSRPFTPQSDRVTSVAAHAQVDLVCPLPATSLADLANQTRYFKFLHRLFPTHFRVIGPPDSRFASMVAECKSVGTILIYNTTLQGQHATSLIEKSRAEHPPS